MQPLRRKIIFKLSFLQKHYIEEIKKNVQLITGTLPSETVSDTLPQPCLAFFDFRLTLRISNQCSHHKETSQLICRPNQLTDFFMMGTLVLKHLKKKYRKSNLSNTCSKFFISSVNVCQTLVKMSTIASNFVNNSCIKIRKNIRKYLTFSNSTSN